LKATRNKADHLGLRGRRSTQKKPLSHLEPRRELKELLGPVEVVPTAASTDNPLISTMELPCKDRPVLLAAIAVGATHLLTGDFRRFGPYYERG
jgi:hypothetical protein